MVRAWIKEILVLTKIDLLTKKDCINKIKLLKNYTKEKVYDISIKDKQSVDKLLIYLLNIKTDIIDIKEEKWTPLKGLMHSSNRIVIKVGSSLLVNSQDSFIDKKAINNICKDINFLISQSKEILVVSSGALALGKKALNITELNLKITEKQTISSIGQILMINTWREALSKYKISCGQFY